MKFLDQSNRILTVTIVGDKALSDKLVIERFKGSDFLSRDFHYEALLLSEDEGLSLEDIQGSMMVVSLKLPDGTWRPFTGLVKFFEFIDKDMRGICSYSARMVPWTDYATLRRNCRIHHRSTREMQFAAILDAYAPEADWAWAVPGARSEEGSRLHTMCVQFNETDRNYMDYRLEMDGTPYRFEHRGVDPFGKVSAGHTMVVYGSTCDAEPIDGASPEVRFHPDRSTSRQQYAITRWSRHAQWGHRTQTVSSYDFKKPRPAQAQVRTRQRAPNTLGLDSHEFVGNYGFTDADDGNRLATLRMEESDVRRQQIFGHSTNPCLQPGRWFRLTEHPGCSRDVSENEYVVSEVHHEAKNNFLLDPDKAPSFTNTFLCHPRRVPWRPGRGWASRPNIVTQVQTATVVGHKLGGAVGTVDVDEFGRPMVRFHWDHEGKYTCRVRLQTPWAGGHKGFAFYPRIGSEVMVAFEMGNPDSPIIQGALANTHRMPPWALPSQSHLSGIRSRQNTEGGGNAPGNEGNHLLFDDTPGRLQWQAFSSHRYSQLSLGVLAHIDGTAGRTRGRGEGYELRTDGHGSERAGLGMFKSTDARTNAIGHATDIREAAQRLTNAQDLHGSLADAAQTAGAQDANDQAPVVEALQRQTAELKGAGGNPDLEKFPEFQAPHILTSSAAGIESAAEGSTHVASNQHTALTSGGHTSISAGKSLLASVREAVRLFAYQAGMKLISASADIDIQALKTSIHLLAKLNVTVTADCIDINAATRLSLSGGGSNITLSGGSILQQTSGQWLAHAARYDMNGPSSVGSRPLPQPMTLADGRLDVLYQYVTSALVQVDGVQQGGLGAVDADNANHGGVLDGTGFDSVAQVPLGMVEVTLDKDPRDPLVESSFLGTRLWPGDGSAAAALASAAAAIGRAASIGTAGDLPSSAPASPGSLPTIAGVAHKVLSTTRSVKDDDMRALVSGLPGALTKVASLASPAWNTATLSLPRISSIFSKLA